MLTIDLNTDLGESSGVGDHDLQKDLELMKLVSSVNIACGYHAGDLETMKHLVQTAIRDNVAIGAHPSFPDRKNLGRMEMSLSRHEIYEIILEQLRVLSEVTDSFSSRLHHVKPHGALYNMAARDKSVAAPVCEAVRDFDSRLVIYGLSGSALLTAAAETGLRARSEVFADRTYQDDGSLTPRTVPGALFQDSSHATLQVAQMALEGTVRSLSGRVLHVRAETVCIHSDGPGALALAQEARKVLLQAGMCITWA